MSRFFSYLKKVKDNPYRILETIFMRFPILSRNIGDKNYLKIIYRSNFNKKLDLSNPVTFNEKLQWLKLYDRKPIYTTMVDKKDAKNYVENIIGSQYIIPALGSWDKFDDIDFGKLPNEFVLKCTHDSGGVVVCKNKKDFDMTYAKNRINHCLKRNFYYQGREWPYKNVKPRIIAEKYISSNSQDGIRDYKFFCFNGEPKIMFVANDRMRDTDTKFDFYDMNFNHLNIKNGHPNTNGKISRPDNFDEMKKLSEKLSQGIPEARIDFYDVDGKIYFGEITLFHWSGFVPFLPDKWDNILGSWVNLPNKK